MKFVADPLTVAFAMGLLGPVAVDEHGIFDDGTPRGTSASTLAEQAITEQQAEIAAEDSLTEDFDFTLTGDFDDALKG